MTRQPLYYYLSQIPDFRIKKGQRHKLADILSMLIMAVLSGRKSKKSISRFLNKNNAVLTTLFGLKHGTPSYGTLHSILAGVKIADFNAALFAWTNAHYPIAASLCLSGDGKALRSTVTNVQDKTQQFIQMVSLYDSVANLVYFSAILDTKKDYEADKIVDIFEQIKTDNAVDLSSNKLRLDALHCQKK
jgi:DDE_Tnp_1-associated